MGDFLADTEMMRADVSGLKLNNFLFNIKEYDGLYFELQLSRR